MQRRDFLRQLLLAGTAAGLGTALGSPPKRLRNVVLLIGDDHSARVLGCYGNRNGGPPLIRTPHLDRLARQGTRFTRAFAQSPICSASRQSFLTGQYPHQTGVNLLFTSFSDERNVTIAEHLKAQGYRTAAIGKMHTNNNQSHGFELRTDGAEYQRWLRAKGGPRPVPAGVPVRDMRTTKGMQPGIWLNPDVRPEPLYDEDSFDTYLARQAAEFITANREDPFLLFVGFHAPHAPMNFPVEFAGRYRPEQMPLGRKSADDERWIPKIFRDFSPERKREVVAGYYTCVEYLDKNVGLVLDALRTNGLDDDTLVVYTSDHGYLLDDHGRFEKHTMWEPAVQTPLLVRAPGIGKPGRVSDELVELVDLVPTFTAATGTPPLTPTQGKSLLPLLRNGSGRPPRTEHRDAIFSEYLIDRLAMLRTNDYKYVFTTGEHDLGVGYETGNAPFGPTHWLFDLRNDPDELRNLAADPRQASRLRAMQAQLIEIFRKTHPDAAKLPPGLSPEQTLAWFCEPRDEVAELEKKLFPDPKRYESRFKK
jgi:arylsulfatase A-like enzyme